MAIQANRFNDPALGAAFSNIASIFAPPSAQDMVGYTTAAGKKAENERLAWLFENANDPLADRKATMAGVYAPTSSYYAVDQNTATDRRGQDITASTALATNAADNERALAVEGIKGQYGIADAFMTPLDPGQVQPGLPGDIASVFGVPALPRTDGAPKPLSETEQKAEERRRLQESGTMTDTMLLDTILGENAPVKAVGEGGPVYMSPGEAARTGAMAAVDPVTPPASIQEYEYYAAAARGRGEEPMPYEEFSVADEKATVPPGTPNIGTIPQGYEAVQDPVTKAWTYRAIPGGPEDPAKKDAAALSNRNTASAVITDAAAAAREADKERWVGGLAGKAASFIPSTPNAEVYRQISVLKANASIENLTAMRAASPTGGALGAVSDRENDMLAAKSGALDPMSPNFARDLDDYERTLLRIVHGDEAGDRIFAETRSNADPAVPGAPEGAAPAAPSASAAPVVVASDADYDALPSGTIFVDPEGKTRRKP